MTRPREVVVVVVGALVADDRVLLVHCSPSRRWYPDVWDLPSGHVEQSGSRSGALVRELYGELGVEVTEGSCQALTTWALTAGDGV